MDRCGFSDNIDRRELCDKEGKLKSPKLEPSRSGVPFRELEKKEADLPGKEVPSFDGEGSSSIDEKKRLKELRRSHSLRDHLSSSGSFQPKSNRISDGSPSEPSRPQEREEIHEASPSQGPARPEQSEADEDKQKKSYSLLEKDVPGKKRKNQPPESKIQTGNVECAREQGYHVNVMRNLPEAREVSQNGEVKKETRGEAEMLRESELGQTCSWFSQVSDRVRQVGGWALQESSKVWQRLPPREAVVRNVGAVMVLGLLTSSLLVPRQTDSFVPELSWERPRKYLRGDKKYSVAVPHWRAVGTSRDVPALQEGLSVGFRGKADKAPELLSEQTNSDNALALPKRMESLSGPADQPDPCRDKRFFEAADLSRYRALYHGQLHMIRKLEIEKIDLDAENKMLQYQNQALDRANKRLQDQIQTQEETIQELQKLIQTFTAIRQSLDPSGQGNSQEDTGINLADGCCRGKADEAPESLSEQTNSNNVRTLPKGMESQKILL